MLKVRKLSDAQPGIPIKVNKPLIDKMLAQLPFSPTGAQARVVEDIQKDMQHARPMMRLVQGDVGSGKTLVAALAALSAIGAGHQVLAGKEIFKRRSAKCYSDSVFIGLRRSLDIFGCIQSLESYVADGIPTVRVYCLDEAIARHGR